jgi:hypothetical protein
MDWQLIVGLFCAGMALWLLVLIESREDEEPLPPPRMDLIVRGAHDAWEVSEAREKTP